MQNTLVEVFKYINNKDNQKKIIQLWEEIVRMESYSLEKDNVNKLASFLKEKFEAEGFDCDLVDVGGGSGNTLVGNLRQNIGGKPIVFSGHMDTVFPEGTFGDELFKIIDGKAYGPGALDMKGGIVISLFVIRALNHAGYNERPIKIIYSGDEEIGHSGSTGAEVFLKEAKDGLCAFNMETGLVDNSICVGRKGRIGFIVNVLGVESHAGNDFSTGRNSIAEMAHKILDFQNLTDLDRGTTVTVSLIKGGTVSNAIPGQCEIEIDARFEKISEMERIEKEIERICNKTFIEGTKAKYEVANSMATYETTEDVLKFYKFVKQIAVENNLPQVRKTTLGGSSDASYVTIAGTPVLCSMGVQGQWNHTKKEYALVESIFNRSKLISAVILNLDKF